MTGSPSGNLPRSSRKPKPSPLYMYEPHHVGVFEATMKVDNRGIVDHEVWACCHVKVDVAVKAGVGVD